MARNYKAEAEWKKEKYAILNISVEKEFKPIIEDIKSKMKLATFMRQALKLYQTNPELFKKED